VAGKGLLPSKNTNPWVPAAGQGVKLNCHGGTYDSGDVVDLVAPEYTTPLADQPEQFRVVTPRAYGAGAKETIMAPELVVPSEIVVMLTFPAGVTGDCPLTKIPPPSKAASVMI
jgi:hypothetical protein